MVTGGSEFKIVNSDQEEKIKENLVEICDIAKLNIGSVLNIIKFYENADLKTAQEE